jgi:hypothetical protein
VRDHWESGTDGGVTKSLADIPGHCGLNNTCKLYVPAGRLMMSTVTPGFGWSASGGVGSVGNRTAAEVVNAAPDGGFRIDTVIV